MSTEKKPKIPVVLYVIVPISLYFIYQSYSRLSVNDYFSGIFFSVVAVVLLGASYVAFKQHKDSLK